MSNEQILSALAAGIQSHTPSQILTALLAALAGGLLIFFVYRLAVSGTAYSRSFNTGNVILTLLTTVIMLMISSNVVISLGMVGALSIVRFRTAVKEVRDTLFLFWSIVHGLCAGSQNYLLAVLAGLFIGAVILFFRLTEQLSPGNYTLIVRCSGTQAAVESVLRAHSRRFRLRAAVTLREEVELVYRVRLSLRRCAALLEELRGQAGISQASFSETESL